MVKYCCDICGKEIARDYVSERLKEYIRPGDLDRTINIELIVGIGMTAKATGVWNCGNICKKCLQDAVINAFTIGDK